MKRQFDTDFEPPKNCIEEKVLDEVSYNAHLRHYQDERKRLQEEFRRDLFEKYCMTTHPKADKIFNKAWDLGISCGYQDVEGYFQDLVELFQDKQSNLDSDISYNNDIRMFC